MTDFKIVKEIQQKDKDIVYEYMRMMQEMFPSDNAYFTIVQLIQHLCLLCFWAVIDSKILTDDEAIQLFEMVSKHRECQSSWELLYREQEMVVNLVMHPVID